MAVVEPVDTSKADRPPRAVVSPGRPKDPSEDGRRALQRFRDGRRDLVKIASSALSPALFGGILLCFLLPFVTISCQREPVVKLTGIRLALGTTVERPAVTDHPRPDPVAGPVEVEGGEPLAFFAFLCAGVGIGLSLAIGRATRPGLAGLAFLGMILLLLLRHKLYHDASDLYRLQFHVGYWLALGGFALAGLVNVVLHCEREGDGGTLEAG